jgi:hypothetical protein
MDRLERAKHRFAELSLKSFLYGCRKGELQMRGGWAVYRGNNARYRTGKIVEINSHSLFSKWFSESGKLVQKLFSAVHEMVDDEDCFVVVMIGELFARSPGPRS